LDGKKETLSDFKINGFIFHRNMIIRVLQLVHIGGTLAVRRAVKLAPMTLDNMRARGRQVA
jgi:hypothetical protein